MLFNVKGERAVVNLISGCLARALGLAWPFAQLALGSARLVFVYFSRPLSGAAAPPGSPFKTWRVHEGMPHTPCAHELTRAHAPMRPTRSAQASASCRMHALHSMCHELTPPRAPMRPCAPCRRALHAALRRPAGAGAARHCGAGHHRRDARDGRLARAAGHQPQGRGGGEQGRCAALRACCTLRACCMLSTLCSPCPGRQRGALASAGASRASA